MGFLTSFSVVGAEEGVLDAGGLKVGNEVPKRGGLVEVAD